MDRMIALGLLLLAAPAAASSGVAIPEPGNWALFALGVAGVLIGRFGLSSGKRDDRDS